MSAVSGIGLGFDRVYVAESLQEARDMAGTIRNRGWSARVIPDSGREKAHLFVGDKRRRKPQKRWQGGASCGS